MRMIIYMHKDYTITFQNFGLCLQLQFLSNAGTSRGLPISCFLNEASDSLDGIVNLWSENVWLAAKGGGIGSYWGNLRSIGEQVGRVGKTSGIIPFIKVMDSLTLAISQGSLRRGSAACYLPIDHPEIEEFIEMRRPTGGDPNRRALNLHHGVLVTDAFMRAVETDDDWALKVHMMERFKEQSKQEIFG
jgi:ribonucleoside-diphosphate reductase alpha chain